MKSVKHVLKNRFVPAISGESSLSNHLQQVIALPIQICGILETNPRLSG